MKLLIRVVLLINLVASFPMYAEEADLTHYYSKPYSEVRISLISDGWEAVPNKHIQDTSRYAQSVYEKGYPEVTNCISMERDQCQFVLIKNQQQILVTTKDKPLNVESIEFYN